MNTNDADLRYFVEIDLDSLQLVRVGSDSKYVLNKGRQDREGVHRLFISKGQFQKFRERCETELQHVLDA